MTSTDYLHSLFNLEGKTAVITGGTRGIGQTMALALARSGASIILVTRSDSLPSPSTLDLINALPSSTSSGSTQVPKCELVTCDLSAKDQVRTLCKRVTGSKEEGGMGRTVDVLVNCGGIQRRTAAENFPDEDWEEVLQVNLSTVFTLSRDFGRHMLSTRGGITGEDAPQYPEGEGREVEEGSKGKEWGGRGNGKIVNVASLISYQGGLTVPAYAAAKHGVAGIVKALSNEWASKGVNVNSIAPGYIATEMNTALIANPTRSRQIMERIPAQRWGSPSDFEGAVVYLASRASDYVSGECLVVDGGWMGR